MKLITTFFAALFGLASCSAQKQEVSVVAPNEFKTAFEQDSNGFLLDVRKPEEFVVGHLKGAALLNWLEEETFKQEAPRILDKAKTIYVYCRSGRRSNAAANWLAEQGYKVVDMKGGILAWNEAGLLTTVFDVDSFSTKSGKRVEITFIKHGTLMLSVGDFTIHVDPVLMFGTDYSKLPKADLLLVTHEHGDHFNMDAIAAVSRAETVFLSNGRVAELSGMSTAMAVGNTKQFEMKNVAGENIGEINITATAAYNNSPGHENFHPKGRDVGFLLEIDGLKIYIAGDTEDIPELASLKDIDVAFLPVNQPYTMTPEQCIRTIEMSRPKIVYPYHFGETDLAPVVEHFKDIKSTEVRIRQMQ